MSRDQDPSPPERACWFFAGVLTCAFVYAFAFGIRWNNVWEQLWGN